MPAPQSRDILTGDEIQQLLWEEPTKPIATSQEERRAEVLFIARRGPDSDLLGSRLTAAGAQLVSVRNPFAALDRLRAAPPRAIVSDLELWAEECALLFERLREARLSVPVLVVAPPSRAPEPVAARLTRAGAWGVLFRPISAGDAEAAARGVVEAASRAPGEIERIQPAEPERLKGPASEDDATSPVTSESPSGGSGPEARLWSETEELACLRFHLELARIGRCAGDLHARSALVLEAARSILAPGAAAVLFRDRGRVRCHADAASEEESLRAAQLLPGRLQHDPSIGAEGDLVVGSTSAPRLLLTGLSAALAAALRGFNADLDALLHRALGDPSDR